MASNLVRWTRRSRIQPTVHSSWWVAPILALVLAACGTTDVGTIDAGAPEPPTPPAIGGTVYVAEAEGTGAAGAFVEGEDASASGGRYVVQPASVGASTTAVEVASLAVSVDAAADYTLWARVWAADASSDAAYLGIDGTLHRVFTQEHARFVWLEVERAFLEAGSHRISLGYGEPGMKIDLFALVAGDAASSEQLEGLVGGPDGAIDPPRPDRGLRADPTFDAGSLVGDEARWYQRILASIDAPADAVDPMVLAGSDDLYTYGRTLHTYVQAVMLAFRLTGDLALLDHLDEIAERMRLELRDGWRGTVDGTDGTRDGYLNWVYRASDEPDLMGKDTHKSNEMRTHAMIAAIAYALETNRDLASPSGRDYAGHADFWQDYLVNHFEAKWRERYGVPVAFPIMSKPHTHTYYAWMKWHYYMGRLTGDAAYMVEANRMADALWVELRPVETPSGTAYVWARSVLSEGGGEAYLHPTTYARYVFGDAVEMRMEGFHRWASDDEMRRFARAFTEYVVDSGDPSSSGFASDIGGGAARAGLVSDAAWSRMSTHAFRWSGYPLISAWDASGVVGTVSAQVFEAQASSGGTILAAGSFLDARLRSEVNAASASAP